MKALFILVSLVIMFCASPASAQSEVNKYKLYLSTADTGATTMTQATVSSGTSPLFIRGGIYHRGSGDTVLKELDRIPSGNATLYIDLVKVNDGAQAVGGANSSNTFFVCARFGHTGSETSMLEKVPLVMNMSLGGNSTYGIPFYIPPGTEQAEFFFVPSGIVSYGRFEGTLFVGIPGTNWAPPMPVCLGERVYTMTVTTGLSTFAGTDSNGAYIPEGSRWAVVQPESSGNSVYFTANGALNKALDQTIAAGDAYPIGGTLGELKRYGLHAGAAASARVKFYNVRPW